MEPIKFSIREKLNRLLPKIIGYRCAINLGRAYISLQNRIKYGDADLFQFVHLEINSHCNRRCWYCLQSRSPTAEHYMTDEVFKLALSRLRELDWSAPVVFHLLNEPLLHPRLVEIVTETKRVLPKSLPHVATNGDMLTLEVADRLVEAGMVRCLITQHPPTTEQWKKKVDEVCRKYPYIFTCMAIPNNKLHNIGGQVPVNNPRLSYCNAPKRSLIIRYTGQLGLCCCTASFENQYIFGDIANSPILTLWNMPRWKELRRNLHSGKRTLPVCIDCIGIR